MTASDIVLVAALVPAAWFALSYGLFSPWYTDPLGWVILLYAISVVALLGLIVYGVVYGQKVDEPVRFLVGFAIFCTLTAKVVILHLERRAGRRDNQRRKAATHELHPAQSPRP